MATERSFDVVNEAWDQHHFENSPVGQLEALGNVILKMSHLHCWSNMDSSKLFSNCSITTGRF